MAFQPVSNKPGLFCFNLSLHIEASFPWAADVGGWNKMVHAWSSEQLFCFDHVPDSQSDE